MKWLTSISLLGMMIFSFSLGAAEGTAANSTKETACIDGKIRYKEGSSVKEIKETYCYDTWLRKIFSSGRCKPNTKCMADFDKTIIMQEEELNVDKKIPGFIICAKASGTPQEIEFWNGEKWTKTARCIFSDGSYIDVGTLATKVVFAEKKSQVKKK